MVYIYVVKARNNSATHAYIYNGLYLNLPMAHAKYIDFNGLSILIPIFQSAGYVKIKYLKITEPFCQVHYYSKFFQSYCRRQNVFVLARVHRFPN